MIDIPGLNDAQFLDYWTQNDAEIAKIMGAIGILDHGPRLAAMVLELQRELTATKTALHGALAHSAPDQPGESHEAV